MLLLLLLNCEGTTYKNLVIFSLFFFFLVISFLKKHRVSWNNHRYEHSHEMRQEPKAEDWPSGTKGSHKMEESGFLLFKKQFFF